MFANKSTDRKHFNKDIFLCHGHHLRLKAHPAAAITHKRSQTLLRYSKIKHAFPHITVTPTVEYILWRETIPMTYKLCPLVSWGGHCCTNSFQSFQSASTPAELSSRESNKLSYFCSLVHKRVQSRNDAAEKHLFWEWLNFVCLCFCQGTREMIYGLVLTG